MKHELKKTIDGKPAFLISKEVEPFTMVGTLLVFEDADGMISKVLEDTFGGKWGLYSKRGAYDVWKSEDKGVITFDIRQYTTEEK